MCWMIFEASLHSIKTGLSVLARWTNVYTFVISLPPHFIRQEGAASELGFLEIKEFNYGT